MGKGAERDAVIFTLQVANQESSMARMEKWENSLRLETRFLPSEISQPVKDYVETIIGGTRTGALDPEEYALSIIEENRGYPPVWHFYTPTIRRVHQQMKEKTQAEGGETAIRVAEKLDTHFEEVVRKAGLRHDRIMGKTISYLISRLKQFPQTKL